MALLNFKAKPAAPAHSAADAFAEHQRLGRVLQQQRLNESSELLAATNAGQRATTEVQAIIDQVDSLIKGGGDQNVEIDDRKIAALELRKRRLEAHGRDAEKRRIEVERKIKDLRTQAQEHEIRTPVLQHAALIEELVALAPEFRAAEEALRAIHFKVFVRVALSDQLAMGNSLGIFFGWGMFGALHLSRPDHPAFQRYSPDPSTAQQEREAELRALDAATAELNHKMLTQAD
jgi:hypothetical protein